MSKLDRSKIQPAQPKIAASLPEAIHESLRPLLSPEIIEGAKAFYYHINDVVRWSIIPDHLMVDFVEKHIVDKLPTEWPAVAKADEIVGGLLVEVLRAYGANPKLPGYWKGPFVALLNGHPERIRPSAETVLAVAGVPFPDIESYSEEKPDLVMLEAAKHWQDRDADEFEVDYA